MKYLITLVFANPSKKESTVLIEIPGIKLALEKAKENFNTSQIGNVKNKKKILRCEVLEKSIQLLLESEISLEYPSRAVRSWIQNFLKQMDFDNSYLYYGQMFRCMCVAIDSEKEKNGEISDLDCMLILTNLFMNVKMKDRYSPEIKEIQYICKKIMDSEIK
ncbi:hypothetical protein [Clostridium butyricum]|uniref:hypothetical protein n=1 Tax=Clostridium butyricum TaxID=1492 RepID=UPI00374E3D8B